MQPFLEWLSLLLKTSITCVKSPRSAQQPHADYPNILEQAGSGSMQDAAMVVSQTVLEGILLACEGDGRRWWSCLSW